jgi:hypothetical protein
MPQQAAAAVPQAYVTPQQQAMYGGYDQRQQPQQQHMTQGYNTGAAAYGATTAYQGYGQQQQQQQQQPGYGYAAAPVAAAAAAPPSLWNTAKAPDGQVYYYNSQTGQTQWDKPPGMP